MLGPEAIDSMRWPRDWVSLVAAIGLLSLAATSMTAGRRSPLARPLAGLCFVLFGWNFAALAGHLSASRGDHPTDFFSIIDTTFTAFSPPFVLEVVLTFVGQLRRQRLVRAATWLFFGGLAAVALAGLTSPDVRKWQELPSYAIAFLVAWVPLLAFEVVVLGRYLAATSDVREKARARTVLAALAIGGSFSLSDLARGAGLQAPLLGAVGTLIAGALLTTLAVRFQLFDRNVSARTTVYVLGLIAAFVVVYLVILHALAGQLGAQIFAGLVVTALVAAAARELGVAVAQARERNRRLTVLGRFAAQMAHDIKGPLTALLGAVDVLEGADGDRETTKEFLGLVSEQAKRVVAIVERYDRMGRVEPRKTRVRIGDVVRSVARAHTIEENAIRLEPELECDADRDLVESALENVVRNATEASPPSGGVAIEARRDAGMLVIRVTDRGEGMDARQLERALEDFFTTKPNGSGLGLAFVRRVMVAHGGDITIASERGKGTTVELSLPA